MAGGVVLYVMIGSSFDEKASGSSRSYHMQDGLLFHRSDVLYWPLCIGTLCSPASVTPGRVQSTSCCDTNLVRMFGCWLMVITCVVQDADVVRLVEL